MSEKMRICKLCNSGLDDEIKYGEFVIYGKISVHTYCLYLSSGLSQNGDENNGLMGFQVEDILNEHKRVEKLQCVYCHKLHANIGCCETRCYRTFHLICGIENGAENQFVGTFRSYCTVHVRKRPACYNLKETCCICYDILHEPGKRSFRINKIRAPCCRNGWFHKFCLQAFARSAGYFFKCPLCNDKVVFRKQLPYMGVFILDRDAAWELEPHAFEDLMQRPNRCEATICKHKNGREYTTDLTDPLVYCITCGAMAVHKHCLSSNSRNYNCSVCIEIGQSTSLSSIEKDSGRESLQTTNDEDMDVDVCNVSDSESAASVNYKSKEESVLNCSEEKDFQSTHSTNNNLQTLLNHKQLIHNRNEIETRKIFCSKATTLSKRFAYVDSSSDEEGIESPQVLAFVMKRKKFRRISDENSNSSSNTINQSRHNVNSQLTSLNNSVNDSDDPLDFLNNHIIRNVHKNNETKTVKNYKEIEFKNPTTANSDLNMDSLKNIEHNNDNNIADISVVANRTRRRKSIYYPEGISEVLDSRETLSKSNESRENKNSINLCNSVNDISSSYFSSSSKLHDMDMGKNDNNSMNISVIANRTRRRKSTYYPDTIKEISDTREILNQDSIEYNRYKNSTSSCNNSNNISSRYSSNDKNNVGAMSVIANRTRRRKSIYSADDISEVSDSRDTLNQDSNESRYNKKSISSNDISSRNSSSNSSNLNDILVRKNDNNNVMNTSVIANRTRHRQSIYSSDSSSKKSNEYSSKQNSISSSNTSNDVSTKYRTNESSKSPLVSPRRTHRLSHPSSRYCRCSYSESCDKSNSSLDIYDAFSSTSRTSSDSNFNDNQSLKNNSSDISSIAKRTRLRSISDSNVNDLFECNAYMKKNRKKRGNNISSCDDEASSEISSNSSEYIIVRRKKRAQRISSCSEN